jgi:tRNA nucleotidyltransferase (CCA-adding enzyme)
MSDYIFMLESHLSASQNQVVSQVQAAAASANVNLFLSGGAVRDMLGGFPVRDLDFRVEGHALKLAKAVAASTGAKILSIDEHRRSVEMLFPGRVTAEIAMARQERYSKPGARPVVTPSTIQEDLLCRDFTINAIALSLNRASLGLLLDPTNGLADLEQKELRTAYPRALYDDPGRMLRLLRLKARFSMVIEARTAQQYENARLDELEKLITPRRLFEELIQAAEEANPGEVLQALAQDKLLAPILPGHTAQKLNLSGFARLQKARQLIPFGVDVPVDNLALFLFLLTEEFAAAERAAFVKTAGVKKAELDLIKQLQAESKKLERDLRSARVTKASHVYQVLLKAPGEQVLYLFLTSPHRQVQDRIRNFLQKYLPAAAEITDRQVAAEGVEPDTPKFKKLKAEMILARLDGKLKKPVEPPPPEPVAPPVLARGAHLRGK